VSAPAVTRATTDRSRTITTPPSAESLTSAVLRVDQTRLIGDEATRIQLVVGDGDAAEPARVLAARARVLGAGPDASIPVTFDERREAELCFAGTALEAHHGWIAVEVDFEDAGGSPARTGTLVWSQPAALVPARFTGRIREVEVLDARHVAVEIDVVRAGRFSFYADLCDLGGERLGYLQGSVELAAGTREVLMRVVADGPTYVISGLRGISFRGERPERLFMPDFPGAWSGGG
jgi:hypothetical protein